LKNAHLQQKKDETLCVTLGTIGAALAATCLYQHFVFMISFWLTNILMVIYIASIIAYVMLAKQKKLAPLFILGIAFLLFFDSLLLVYTRTFSLIVFMFTMFNIIVVIVMYTIGLPKRLHQYYLDQKAENEFWEDKI